MEYKNTMSWAELQLVMPRPSTKRYINRLVNAEEEVNLDKLKEHCRRVYGDFGCEVLAIQFKDRKERGEF